MRESLIISATLCSITKNVQSQQHIMQISSCLTSAQSLTTSHTDGKWWWKLFLNTWSEGLALVVLTGLYYCISATQHIVSFSIRIVPHVSAQKSQKQQGDKVLSDSSAVSGDWHWCGLCVTEQTPLLFSFTDDWFTVFWVVLWHCKQLRWLVSLPRRPHGVLCGDAMAIHFTAICSGWAHIKCSHMHAGSLVIRYRMSAVRAPGRASWHCQM